MTLAAQVRAERSGRDLYLAACAACHGADGRGASRERVGFETPLPDFSDCRFATPEPDADWSAVVHRGGPARAFDRRMPAFADALSAEEIARVIAHLRGFCTDRSWPRGELNLPRALFTEKAFPENEALTIASMATGGAGDFAQTFIYERRLGARQQLEVTAPLTVTRADGAWTGGVGDMTVGLKHVLAHSIERGSILTVGSELVLPTGDEEAGGGVTRIEPFVAFGRMLPSDGFLQAQAGVELSTSPARAPHEAFWRAALGRSFSQHTFGRTWSPMIEVLGARELESGASAEWDVTPQLQVTLSTRQHIAASGGVRIPVSQRGSRHARVIVYVLWDWFDGGLASGW